MAWTKWNQFEILIWLVVSYYYLWNNDIWHVPGISTLQFISAQIIILMCIYKQNETFDRHLIQPTSPKVMEHNKILSSQGQGWNIYSSTMSTFSAYGTYCSWQQQIPSYKELLLVYSQYACCTNDMLSIKTHTGWFYMCNFYITVHLSLVRILIGMNDYNSFFKL